MKRPPCSNWDGKRCELDLFGGRPSPGVCERCDEYDGPPRGLGDRVERIANATGIGPMVKRATRGRCRCSERRTRLNALTRKPSRVDDRPTDG